MIIRPISPTPKARGAPVAAEILERNSAKRPACERAGLFFLLRAAPAACVQLGVELIRAYPATNACPLFVGYISRLQPVTARLRLFNMAALALEMMVSDPVP